MDSSSVTRMHTSPPLLCPLCNVSGTFTHLETHTDKLIEYHLYSCPQCKAQWWEPLKNPGAHWYESDVRYAGRNGDPILEANVKHRTTISYLLPFRGRVLDVGCGVGNFLAWAKQYGWECYGIDFDADGIEAGKRTFGLDNLEATDLKTYVTNHTGETFDLVTFFDVFEHIDDHRAFIELVRSLLNRGGHLSLSTPYRGGSRWLVAHDFPPRHLTRWDLESLTTFLQAHGFRVVYGKLLPASFFFVVTKIRVKYGRMFSFGLIQKMKDTANHSTVVSSEKKSAKLSLKIRIAHTLAKTKDIILFGIPALFIWSALLFTKKRYTDLVLIAQRTE